MFRKTLMACVLFTSTYTIAAGLEVVNNGKKPATSPLTLELSKTLERGPEDGDDFIWTGVGTSMQVDQRGHIFIVDTDENRILEYNSNGEKVRQIGKPGQGPGEFQMLRSFSILQDGTAIAFENMGAFSALSFYDADLQFKERKTINGIGRSPRFVDFSPDGKRLTAFCSIWDGENSREITEFLVMDVEFNVLKSVSTWESIIFDQARINDTNFWIEFLAARLQGQAKGLTVYMGWDQAGRLYSGKADKYEITVWSKDTKPMLKFSREYDPKPLTEAELDAIVTPLHQSVLTHLPDSLHSIVNKNVVAKAVEKAEFNPSKFPVQGVIGMGEDHVLIVHENNIDTGIGQADIFTHEGKFVGSFTHPRHGLRNMLFRDGKAYVLEQDENEELLMVRYDAKLVPSEKASQP
jgi:hypothetical protein